MKANDIQKFASEFRAAIVSNLKDMAVKSGAKSAKGVPMLALGTDVLKAAAFPAFQEAADAQSEAPSAIECAIVWEGVLKLNESAFRQGLEREAKLGLIGFEIVGSARAAKGLALQYLPKEDQPQG